MGVRCDVLLKVIYLGRAWMHGKIAFAFEETRAFEWCHKQSRSRPRVQSVVSGGTENDIEGADSHAPPEVGVEISSLQQLHFKSIHKCSIQFKILVAVDTMNCRVPLQGSCV